MGAFNIPLMVDHPQFETSSQAENKLLGLKQLANSVRMQGQAEKLGDLRIKQDELEIKDAELQMEDNTKKRRSAAAWSEIYRANDGDMDKAVAAAKAHKDITPDYVQALEQANLNRKSADLKYRADLATFDDAKLTSQRRRDDEFGKSLAAVRAVPAPERASVLESEIKRNLDLGTITAEQAKQALNLDLSSDDALLATERHYRGQAAVAADIENQRKADKAKADASKVEFQTALEDAQRSFGVEVEEGNDESLKAWRDKLPQKMGDRDFRRLFPDSFNKKVNGRTVGEHLAFLTRTPAQEDAYQKSKIVKPDANPNDIEAIAAGLRAEHSDWSADKILGEAQKIKFKQGLQEKAASKSDGDKKDPNQTRIDQLQKQKDDLAAEAMAAGEASKSADEDIEKLLGVPEGLEGKDRQKSRYDLLNGANDDIKAEVAKLVTKRNEANKKVRETQAKFTEHDRQQNELTSRSSGKPTDQKKPVEIDQSKKSAGGFNVGQPVMRGDKKVWIKGFTKDGQAVLTDQDPSAKK